MGAFEYKVLDAGGKEQRGVLEGDTPRQVRQQLRDRGLIPLSVQEGWLFVGPVKLLKLPKIHWH